MVTGADVNVTKMTFSILWGIARDTAPEYEVFISLRSLLEYYVIQVQLNFEVSKSGLMK